MLSVANMGKSTAELYMPNQNTLLEWGKYDKINQEVL